MIFSTTRTLPGQPSCYWRTSTDKPKRRAAFPRILQRTSSLVSENRQTYLGSSSNQQTVSSMDQYEVYFLDNFGGYIRQRGKSKKYQFQFTSSTVKVFKQSNKFLRFVAISKLYDKPCSDLMRLTKYSLSLGEVCLITCPLENKHSAL